MPAGGIRPMEPRTARGLFRLT